MVKKPESTEKNLSGFDNKRLEKTDSTNNEATAAWANAENLMDESRVAIPAGYDVEKAKNWVDNGSKL